MTTTSTPIEPTSSKKNETTKQNAQESTATTPALDDMVTVEFHDDNDGSVTSIRVPTGTRLTEAATRAGVMIPTLCHHPRLIPAGKCGMCLVHVEEGPTPTQLACSTLCRRPTTTTTTTTTNTSSDKNNDSNADANANATATANTPIMRVHVHGTLLNGLANAALQRSLQNQQQPARPQHHHNDEAKHESSDLLLDMAASKDYPSCAGGTVELEDLGQWMRQQMVDRSSNSILYDPSLCIGCTRCIRACDQIQGMNILEQQEIPAVSSLQQGTAAMQALPCASTTTMRTRAGRKLRETDCIACGQCTVFCPTGAIREVDHTPKVMQALSDPTMTVVLQTAPSVRVAIAEMFRGGEPGLCSEGQLVGAAKAAGFRFVFDTNVAADLTIMEEAHELLQRINIASNGSAEEKDQKPLPMFTSCCPGWINLVEQSYPQWIPHISTCRSPMSMLSSVIRHDWWPRQTHILHQHGRRAAAAANKVTLQYNDKERDKQQSFTVDQSKLFVVAVMPCTAKKDEIAREQFRMRNGQPETDAVLTVREFARLLELRGVAQRSSINSFLNLPELVYDNPFGESTGAAIIFGVTGGVMEAALRTAADVLSGKDLKELKYDAVRGLYGIKQANVLLGANKEIQLNAAVVHQMRNVKEFLADIEEGKKAQYHFIEVMTCPGGCIGGGGLPQSRHEDILERRIRSVYSLDEKMVKRKSHDSQAVKDLYNHLLGKPLSEVSHSLLHTHYFARPRKPPITLNTTTSTSQRLDLSEDSNDNAVYVLFGTQSGTTAQAAKEVKVELQQYIARSKLSSPEPQVLLVGANTVTPEAFIAKASKSLATVFLTSTFGQGEFPDTMLELWKYLEGYKGHLFSSEEGSVLRYAVFGLGSSMYAIDDQFNRAANLLDRRLEELGGERLVEVGLGDDQASELYHGALDPWMEKLLPKVFGSEATASASYLDPPEPLYRVSIAPGRHRGKFRPLPPNYHYVTLKSKTSIVPEGYDRPACLFSFDLEGTGLDYQVGDHLALLPRNPESVVQKILHLYSPEVQGLQLLSVEATDSMAESPFPNILSAKELLQYLDLCGRPTRNLFKQLFLFSTTVESRKTLRSLFQRDDSDADEAQFEFYTGTHTYADVLVEFASTSLPPFEYLLSMIPTITPRLYSIASSPLYKTNQLDLLVVLMQWKDAAQQTRLGLSTQYLFDSHVGDTMAVQIRQGILQPPSNPADPLVMFGLGTGVAPFRGFLQHRQRLLETGVPLGPAVLYVGCRHEDQDFYLEKDCREWMDHGVLTNLHAAFSHDHVDERGGKLYFLPDLIADHPLDMVRALQVYPCIKKNGKRMTNEEEKNDATITGISNPSSPEDAETDRHDCDDRPVHVYYCGPALGIPESIQSAMQHALTSVLSDGDTAGDAATPASAWMDRLVHQEDRFHAECF